MYVTKVCTFSVLLLIQRWVAKCGKVLICKCYGICYVVLMFQPVRRTDTDKGLICDEPPTSFS